MKITYTNTPVNRQKKNYPTFKAIFAMSCVIALMVAVKVIYSPDESIKDVAAMANATAVTRESETQGDTEAVQTSVIYFSSSSYMQNESSAQTFTPLQGKISSGFSNRIDPFGSEKGEFHYGIDIVPADDRHIIAYAEGDVIMAEYDPSYGNFIKLSHENGIETIYAHCSELKVKEGDRVSAGQIIAVTGNTGRSTGEHLHFEVRENGVAVDPKLYL